MSEENLRSIGSWVKFSRRDDCLDRMTPSDLRLAITVAYRAGYLACVQDVMGATNKPVHEIQPPEPNPKTD